MLPPPKLPILRWSGGIDVSRNGFRVIGRRILGSPAFIETERLHMAGPDGSTLVRIVVRHPGAVAVVPIHQGSVVLIRQYRAAIGREVLEVPAGKLNVPGEAPELAAKRELEEEVGFRAGSLEPLTAFVTTPGFCDERIVVYLAEDLTPVPATPHGVEEELAEVVHIPLGELRTRLWSGEFDDAKTMIALAAFLARAS